MMPTTSWVVERPGVVMGMSLRLWLNDTGFNAKIHEGMRPARRFSANGGRVPVNGAPAVLREPQEMRFLIFSNVS